MALTNADVIQNAINTDTIAQLNQKQLGLYKEGVRRGDLQPSPTQQAAINRIPVPTPKFDPMGTGYDYETAHKYGINPSPVDGHWQSLVPETGQVLKGANHSTFDKTVAAERRMGNNIVYDETGRLYSMNRGALRDDGTEKGAGFLGSRKMTDGSGRVVTDMTIRGGLRIDGIEQKYPLLVSTLNEAEVEVLMRGGDIPDSIRNKAIKHAKDRIEEGLSPFSAHAPETSKKFAPFYAYEELSNDKPKTGGYLSALLRGLGEGITTEFPSMGGRALQMIGLKKVGKAIVDWAEEKSDEMWGTKPEYEGFARWLYEAGTMIPSSVIPGGLSMTGAKILLKMTRLKKAIDTTGKVLRARKLSHAGVIGRGGKAVGNLKGFGARESKIMSARAVVKASKAQKLAIKNFNKSSKAVDWITGASVGTFFGLSQAQATKDTMHERIAMLEEQGDIDGANALRSKLWWAPLATGAIEGIGETIGARYLSMLFRVKPGIITQRTSKEFVENFLLNAGRTMGVEIGTEMGQAGGQAAVEKYAGVRPEARMMSEMVSVIGPTAVMTLLLGGASGAMNLPGVGKQIRQNELRGIIDNDLGKHAVNMGRYQEKSTNITRTVDNIKVGKASAGTEQLVASVVESVSNVGEQRAEQYRDNLKNENATTQPTYIEAALDGLSNAVSKLGGKTVTKQQKEQINNAVNSVTENLDKFDEGIQSQVIEEVGNVMFADSAAVKAINKASGAVEKVKTAAKTVVQKITGRTVKKSRTDKLERPSRVGPEKPDEISSTTPFPGIKRIEEGIEEEGKKAQKESLSDLTDMPAEKYKSYIQRIFDSMDGILDLAKNTYESNVLEIGHADTMTGEAAKQTKGIIVDPKSKDSAATMGKKLYALGIMSKYKHTQQLKRLLGEALEGEKLSKTKPLTVTQIEKIIAKLGPDAKGSIMVKNLDGTLHVKLGRETDEKTDITIEDLKQNLIDIDAGKDVPNFIREILSIRSDRGYSLSTILWNLERDGEIDNWEDWLQVAQVYNSDWTQHAVNKRLNSAQRRQMVRRFQTNTNRKSRDPLIRPAPIDKYNRVTKEAFPFFSDLAIKNANNLINQVINKNTKSRYYNVYRVFHNYAENNQEQIGEIFENGKIGEKIRDDKHVEALAFMTSFIKDYVGDGKGLPFGKTKGSVNKRTRGYVETSSSALKGANMYKMFGVGGDQIKVILKTHNKGVSNITAESNKDMTMDENVMEHAKNILNTKVYEAEKAYKDAKAKKKSLKIRKELLLERVKARRNRFMFTIGRIAGPREYEQSRMEWDGLGNISKPKNKKGNILLFFAKNKPRTIADVLTNNDISEATEYMNALLEYKDLSPESFEGLNLAMQESGKAKGLPSLINLYFNNDGKVVEIKDDTKAGKVEGNMVDLNNIREKNYHSVTPESFTQIVNEVIFLALQKEYPTVPLEYKGREEEYYHELMSSYGKSVLRHFYIWNAVNKLKVGSNEADSVSRIEAVVGHRNLVVNYFRNMTKARESLANWVKINYTLVKALKKIATPLSDSYNREMPGVIDSVVIRNSDENDSILAVFPAGVSSYALYKNKKGAWMVYQVEEGKSISLKFFENIKGKAFPEIIAMTNLQNSFDGKIETTTDTGRSFIPYKKPEGQKEEIELTKEEEREIKYLDKLERDMNAIVSSLEMELIPLEEQDATVIPPNLVKAKARARDLVTIINNNILAEWGTKKNRDEITAAVKKLKQLVATYKGQVHGRGLNIDDVFTKINKARRNVGVVAKNVNYSIVPAMSDRSKKKVLEVENQIRLDNESFRVRLPFTSKEDPIHGRLGKFVELDHDAIKKYTTDELGLSDAEFQNLAKRLNKGYGSKERYSLIIYKPVQAVGENAKRMAQKKIPGIGQPKIGQMRRYTEFAAEIGLSHSEYLNILRERQAFTPESFNKVRDRLIMLATSMGARIESIDFIDAPLSLRQDLMNRNPGASNAEINNIMRQTLVDQGIFKEGEIDEAIRNGEDFNVAGKHEVMADGQAVLTLGHGATLKTAFEEIAHTIIQQGGEIEGVTDGVLLGDPASEERAAKALADWLFNMLVKGKVPWTRVARKMTKRATGFVQERKNVIEDLYDLDKEMTDPIGEGGELKNPYLDETRYSVKKKTKKKAKKKVTKKKVKEEVTKKEVKEEVIGDASYVDSSLLLADEAYNKEIEQDGQTGAQVIAHHTKIIKEKDIRAKLSTIPEGLDINKIVKQVVSTQRNHNETYDLFINQGLRNSSLASKIKWKPLRVFLEFWQSLSSLGDYEYAMLARLKMRGGISESNRLINRIMREIKKFDRIYGKGGPKEMSNWEGQGGIKEEIMDFLRSKTGSPLFDTQEIQEVDANIAAELGWRKGIIKLYNLREAFEKGLSRLKEKHESTTNVTRRAAITENINKRKIQIKETNERIEKLGIMTGKGPKTGPKADNEVYDAEIGINWKREKVNHEAVSKKDVLDRLDVKMKKLKELRVMADYNALKSPAVRMPDEIKKLAFQIKAAQTKLGYMLFERGVISADTYWKYHGKYIHYMYKKDFLLSNRDDIPGEDLTVDTGTVENWLGERKILDSNLQDAYGFVNDWAAPISTAMADTLRYIANLDYYKGLKRSPELVLNFEGVAGVKWKENEKEWVITQEVPSGFREWWERHYITKKPEVMLTRVVGEKGVERDWKIMEMAEAIVVLTDMLNDGKARGDNMSATETLLESMKKAYKPVAGVLKKAGDKNLQADYRKFTGERYGELEGQYVAKPVYDDIMPITSQAELHSGAGYGAALRGVTQSIVLFKIGKATLNFPTAFRNVISNVLQNNLRGRPLGVVMDDFRKAIAGMLRKNPDGEYGYDMVSALKADGTRETIDVFLEFLNHAGDQANMPKEEIEGMVAEYRHFYKGGNWFKFMTSLSKLSKYYGSIDIMAKYSIYRQLRTSGELGKWSGMGTNKYVHPELAMEEAQKWGMDYSLTSRSIKQFRKFLVPFITYQYKATSLIAESIIKRPWVMGKWALLMGVGAGSWSLAREAAQFFIGMDDDEWERTVKNLAHFVKNEKTFMPLPFRNAQGEVMFFDGSYFMPWGTWYNAVSDLSEGELTMAYQKLGVGNPFLTSYTALSSVAKGQPAIDPFTHKPLWNITDSTPRKWHKIISYMHNIVTPGMFENFTLPGADKYGAIPLSARVLASKIKGKEAKDTWGRVKGWEQFGRYFGVNTVTGSRRQVVTIKQARIKRIRASAYKELRSPSYRGKPAKKRAVLKRMKYKIKEIMAE